MKRLLSAFLLLTFLVTLCAGTVVVSADRTYLVNQEGTAISYAGSSAIPVTKTEVDGVYGRAKGDKSVYAERAIATTGSLKNSYVNTSLTNLDTTKDLIVETSFIPVSNIKNLQLGTNQNASVGISNIPVENFNGAQWNKYKLIIDLTKSENNAKVYINGKLYGTYTFKGITDNVFRFIFNSSDTTYLNPIGIYMDYFYVYQETTGVETGVEAMPFTSASGTGYSYNSASNLISFDSAYTAGELKGLLGVGDTTALRVYADSKYKTVLADSDKISDGNVIVLQTATDLFQYINVDVEDGLETIYTHDGSTADNSTGSAKTVIGGYNGKSSSDKVLAYSRSSSNAYFRPSGVNNFVDTSKVLIADMQFLVGDTVTGFTLGSASNAQITKAFGNVSADNFNANRWNNLRAVIDFTNNKASLYLNDVKISSTETVTYDNTSNGGLRFIFTGTSPVEVCFDNIKMYQTSLAFEQVDKGFAYAVTASTDAYTFENGKINFNDEYKTLAQVKTIFNLGDSAEVRGYSANFDAELGEADALSGGTLIVIEKATGEIQTLEVEILEPEDKPTTIYYNNGSKTANGTSSKILTGVKGRTADDSSIQVAKSANSGLIWCGTPADTLSLSNINKELVYEYSFVPPEGFEYVSLAHSANADIGTGNIPESAFVKDAWNKIKLIWNLTTNKAELYINGVLYKSDVNMISALPTELRSVFHIDASVETPYMYMDEFKVYINDIGFESGEEAYFLAEEGDNYIINIDTMTFIGDEITVSDFKTAFADENIIIRAYSEGYGSLIDETATLSTGDRIVIVAPDNIITTYTFEEIAKNKMYLKGAGCYSDTQFVSDEIKVTVLTDGKAVLVASQFDENNRLIDIKTKDVTEAGWLKYNYTPADTKGKVRFMLFDTLPTAKPLDEKIELGYRQSLSVLIVGNSFSTDSTKYLREIAAADGVEINVGRLIKGGSDLQHHYDSRETTEDVNVLHYNGISTGYTNLKTVLEDYEWDYVAVQNWSSKSPDQLTDDYWTPVGENLIAYIHENEPNAEILINKTWSFEKGYSYVTDSAVQEETNTYLTEKTEMLAQNAAEKIGVDKIRIVPAGDAFTAARNYSDENGVNIFDTTYYAEGHSFTSDMNRQTIEVGQGILSPEEDEAGYIRLHRDGFHSSLLARVMLASVWYEALTGNNVVGNTFVPEPDAIDSGAVVMDESGSLVVYYKFNSPTQDRIDLVQRIVHTMMQSNADWNE